MMDSLRDLPWTLLVLSLLCVWVGHAVLVIANLNWWYGVPLPHHWHTPIRLLSALAIALFGPALLLAFYLSNRDSSFPDRAVDWVLLAYLSLCALYGAVVFPLLTLYRALRRPPVVLARSVSRIVDVAAELGFKPVGRGKLAFLAHFPRNEIFQVDFAERTLLLPTLPAAWDGLTILHLTDMHFRGTPDRSFYRYVFEQCRDWGEVDLVAVTGDIVDSKRHYRWIVPLFGRLKYRIAGFAILGNHDYWYDPPLVRRQLRRAGLRVLGNSWEQIDVAGLPLVVLGHEGPWFRPGPDLSDCPEGPFRLCLSHTPDNIAWARRNNVGLMLSGHNHGGQVRFPVIGSSLAPSRYSRRYDCGCFHEPPTVLYVSRGLAAQHPIRFRCHPEVTKITLKAGS